MRATQRPRKPAPDTAPSAAGDLPQLEDRSYLAYLRPTPRPFLHFASGHFPAARSRSLTAIPASPCMAACKDRSSSARPKATCRWKPVCFT